MFDTNIVVIGNVLTAPEWRRTANSQTLVANFRVASTARRLDKETGRWVDGNHLRVRVNCWRRLAEGVASSVTVGDPVVVAGRLYTRDWTDSEGNLRTTYEMEAVSVGHDLSRGRAKFFRTKPAATAAVENPESGDKVRGEAATPIPDEDAPAVYGDGLPDGDEPAFADVPVRTPEGFDPVAALRGGGFEPFDTGITVPPAAADMSSGAESERLRREAEMLVDPLVGDAHSTAPATESTDEAVSARPARAEQASVERASVERASVERASAEQPSVEQPSVERAAAEQASAEPGGARATAEPSPRRMRGRAPRRQPVAV
ncbi:single-stranded DNA-binding protein [Couchioplanes azureus]|uniref:single-stranded DNA-binding protein n=1 Tax=Couchioplanes caeruleus TaxID=56438 RepID=UPI0016713308|nr:single-stranded DNA-binding protein [Couchioplanes caeruleus]GGQ78155.1 hypothetical protein GCM10010166_55310 [Couchioplanes caeruleus subsp. azureus]